MFGYWLAPYNFWPDSPCLRAGRNPGLVLDGGFGGNMAGTAAGIVEKRIWTNGLFCSLVP